MRRELGVFDATMLGLGSILGTGVFVSIGIASGVAGTSVVLAVFLAGLLAICNALNSAQLAANHPVSGGTYEYGYQYLSPALGFSAGWLFLCAKSASAATAALGFAGYLALATGLSPSWTTSIAFVTVILITFVVLMGIRRSSQLNIAFVVITIASLVVFIFAGSTQLVPANLEFEWQPANLLHASALMFVAFTGYGRIATLGEEVKQPRKTIPRAIIVTLTLSMALYLAVAMVAVGTIGAMQLSSTTSDSSAPLQFAAKNFPWNSASLVSIGATTAMLGVLLNLVLGLSRVLLAMGRRGDMPAGTNNLSTSIVVVGIVIAGLTLSGNVKTTWSFSAFTVLVYYAITNLAALKLPRHQRLYSPIFAWVGLAGCLSLAFAISTQFWIIGIVILGIGLVWFASRQQ